MMPLDQALAAIVERKIILHYTDDSHLIGIWTPASQQSTRLLRAISANRVQVYKLMREGHIQLCPSRDLHRRYYTYRDGRYWCSKCRELDKAIAS